MASPDAVREFHAHIYFDEAELDRARALAAAAQERFAVTVGRFHLRQVGPHPRGSCQLTVSAERFGELAAWLPLHRDDLTIFAHPVTADEFADHSAHVVWFGPSEQLDLSFFGARR